VEIQPVSPFESTSSLVIEGKFHNLLMLWLGAHSLSFTVTETLMLNLNLLAATRTIETTMPFILYRLLLSLAVGLALLLATLAGAGTIIGFSFLSKNPAAFAQFGAVAGFIACGFAFYKLRSPWLYTVISPHLALLSAHARNDPLPEGKAQIDFAKQSVLQRFPHSTELFELDQAIQQTLALLPEIRLPVRFQNARLNQLIHWMLGGFMIPNHQTILAWHYFSGAENAWRSAKISLCMQAEHFSLLLKQRVLLTAFELLGLIAGYTVLLFPMKSIAGILPVTTSFWPYIFAFVFAWVLKASFFEPISQAAMLQSVFPLMQDGSYARWQSELGEKSEAFRKIQARSGS
jgi:hypothetical protein